MSRKEYLKHCIEMIDNAEERINDAKVSRELGLHGKAVDEFESHANRDKEIYVRIRDKILEEESL